MKDLYKQLDAYLILRDTTLSPESFCASQRLTRKIDKQFAYLFEARLIGLRLRQVVYEETIT